MSSIPPTPQNQPGQPSQFNQYGVPQNQGYPTQNMASPQYGGGAPQMPPKKPFYKRVWFIVLMALVVLGVIIGVAGGGKDSSDSASKANKSTSANGTTTVDSALAPAPVVPADANGGSSESEGNADSNSSTEVSSEFRSALRKAKTYSDSMHMSKAGLYAQLTSEYGEKFTPEEADYAIAHLD